MREAATTAVASFGRSDTEQHSEPSIVQAGSTPDSPQFRWQLPLLWFGSCVLILAAVVLAALSMHFHQEYGKATQAVLIANKSGAIGPSPEPFLRRAESAFFGIGLVCLIALILTLTERHPIALGALVVCIAILLYTMGQICMRY
jgi:1,4-dihydroxy-2-naphthoate octaprenyltransferase